MVRGSTGTLLSIIKPSAALPAHLKKKLRFHIVISLYFSMRKTLLFLVCLFQLPSSEAAAQNPVDTILNRAERFLRNMSLKDNDGEDVNKIVSSLQGNQQWSDIDYTHKDPSGWKVTTHLQRLRRMALTWTDPASSLYKDASLRNAIDAALGHWLEKRYQNPNWWHNAIGIPRLMQDIIVLLRHDLSPEQFKQAMEVLGQHKVGGTGANLVWSADLGLHYGALSGDVSMIKKCSDLISHEIRVTTKEGIQPDYSYHQHGPRLQTYHYGGAFLRENVKLAWELRGTPWAFSEEKTDILVNFVLEGWQWMSREIYTVPGTIDRAVSRKDALASADLRRVIPYLVQLKPEKSRALAALNARQEGSGTSLEGFKHYPYSDFSAYHHPGFSFFLKTISVRTRFSESINCENLKGRLLNSGDGYFVRDGLEYYNLMPVWNWEYLPGVTAFPQGVTKQENFTGGVSAGESGFTVMQLRAEHDAKRLGVKKFWASHGDVVVCLMADFQRQEVNVYTALDQCRWRTDVLLNDPANIIKEGVHHLKDVQWIHHGGFAYIPISSEDIELHLTSATGTWSSINQSGSDEIVTEKVFMPVLRHAPSSTSAGYFVASCKRPEEAGKLQANPPFKIIQNDEACQSVRFRDGTWMTAFFASGVVAANKKQTLSADRPCLVVLSKGKLFASDPTHNGGDVSIRMAKKVVTLALPADGSTVAVEL